MAEYHFKTMHMCIYGILALQLSIYSILVVYVGLSSRHYTERGTLPRKYDLTTVTEMPKEYVNNVEHGRTIHKPITDYDEATHEEFKSLYHENPSNTQLISLINMLIDNHTESDVKIPFDRVVATPQSQEVDKLFHFKTKGFFVECGAYDGETSSNTLYLEYHRQWTGILVEVDPYLYTQMRGKNRKSLTLNTCLSPEKKVIEMFFKESPGQNGKVLPLESLRENTKMKKVNCVPFESIMAALNRTKVDYFSLDTDGNELDILKTIPFNKLDIEVLSVNYGNTKFGKQVLAQYMTQRGYVTYKDLQNRDSQEVKQSVSDLVFVKRDLLYVDSAESNHFVP